MCIDFFEVMKMEEKINEAAVWNRVSAASRSGEPGRGKSSGDGPIGPDLLDAIARERETAQEYRRLALRAGAEGQRVLRKISAQEQQHGQTLGALYFFLTGQAPQIKPIQPQNRQESFREALRRQMQSEELVAGRYEALAARSTGEVRQVLLQISQEERQHFHLLLGLLKTAL